MANVRTARYLKVHQHGTDVIEGNRKILVDTGLGLQFSLFVDNGLSVLQALAEIEEELRIWQVKGARIMHLRQRSPDDGKLYALSTRQRVQELWVEGDCTSVYVSVCYVGPQPIYREADADTPLLQIMGHAAGGRPPAITPAHCRTRHEPAAATPNSRQSGATPFPQPKLAKKKRKLTGAKRRIEQADSLELLDGEAASPGGGRASVSAGGVSELGRAEGEGSEAPSGSTSNAIRTEESMLEEVVVAEQDEGTPPPSPPSCLESGEGGTQEASETPPGQALPDGNSGRGKPPVVRWVRTTPGRKQRVGNSVWSGPFSSQTDSDYQSPSVVGVEEVQGGDEGATSPWQRPSKKRRVRWAPLPSDVGGGAVAERSADACCGVAQGEAAEVTAGGRKASQQRDAEAPGEEPPLHAAAASTLGEASPSCLGGGGRTTAVGGDLGAVGKGPAASGSRGGGVVRNEEGGAEVAEVARLEPPMQQADPVAVPPPDQRMHEETAKQEAFEDRYFDPTDLWNGEYSDLLRSAAPPYHAGLRGKDLIGQPFGKVFFDDQLNSCIYFLGKVMEYNTVKGEGLYYGVLYGDDDEEDLDEESLLKLLKIYNRRLGKRQQYRAERAAARAAAAAEEAEVWAEEDAENVPSPLASPSSIPATSPAAAAPPPAVPTEDLVVAPAAPRRKSLRLPKGMRAMGPPTPPDAVRGGEAGGAGEGTAGGVGPAGVGVRVAGGAESECTMIPDSSDESDSESISESISGSDEVRGIGRGMPSDIIFAASGGSAETGEEVRQPGGRGTVGSKSGSEEEAGQRDWPAQQ